MAVLPEDRDLRLGYIIVGGLGLMFVLGIGMFAQAFLSSGKTTDPQSDTGPDRIIEMTAGDWFFDPSEITVQEGQRIRLEITTWNNATERYDHGIGIPALGVDTYLPAGETTVVEFTADEPGEYQFFCNNFCGQGHSDMRGTLIVEE